MEKFFELMEIYKLINLFPQIKHYQRNKHKLLMINFCYLTVFFTYS